jgi:hypothetical protein
MPASFVRNFNFSVQFCFYIPSRFLINFKILKEVLLLQEYTRTKRREGAETWFVGCDFEVNVNGFRIYWRYYSVSISTI